MKHLLTVLIMVGGIVASIGVGISVFWATDKVKEFIYNRPKLDEWLDKAGMWLGGAFIISALIFALIVSYFAIYEML